MQIAPTSTRLPPGSTCYIDLTGFLHRLAYMPGPQGLKPEQVTSKITGEPTWGIVGTFNQLNTLAKQRPSRIVAFADSSQDGFRAEMLPSYKRKSGSPYLRQQLNRLAQCLPFLGIATVGAREEFPGMEAEDLISRAVKDAHEPLVVVSYDKDLLQLVRKNVSYYNPQRKQLITDVNINEHLKRHYFSSQTELTGPDMAVFLACTGDSVDGVKPIGGIGPVTLGSYYDKLPAGLSNREKLEALQAIDCESRHDAAKRPDWRQAFINLEATDLNTHRQEDLLFGRIPEHRPNKEAFRKVLDELTMPSFLNQYDRWFAPFESSQSPAFAFE